MNAQQIEVARPIKEVTDYPEASKTMLILVNDRTGEQNYLANINDITLIESGNAIIVDMPLHLPELPTPPFQIIIDYTNDPTYDKACAWTSLGHSRARFDIKDATHAIQDDKGLTIVAPKGRLTITSTACDR